VTTPTDSLRRFVSKRTPEAWQPSATPVTVVAGTAAGIGTSTVAALLGSAMAQNGHRTLLVDTDETDGGVHRILGATRTRGIGALLDADVAVDDLTLEVGAQCLLLPGGATPKPWRAPFDPTARRTVLRRVAQRFAAYDAIVVDAGAKLDAILAATEVGVRRVVVVGGASPAQVAAAYAVLKALDLRWPSITVDLLVNATAAEAARAAYEQVHFGAQHFLSRSIGFAGHLPDDDALRAATDLPLYRCAAETAVAVHQLAAACVADPAAAHS
jgi:MinD-like ATPase involved in chromosome partitioning or flagellar assembly